MGLTDRVRKLDIFKKVPQDFQEGTNKGGALSILTVASITFFLLVQIRSYIHPDYSASLVVPMNPVTRKQMMVHLDITLPRFPCEIISVDLQDLMMSHSANIGSVLKYRLDSNGNEIDGGQPFELLNEPSHEKQYQMAKTAFQNKYGCKLRGDFTVKEVPGNFHISSHAYQNIYAKLRMQRIIETLDMSHKIHYLFFGDMRNVSKIIENHPQAVLAKLSNHDKIYDMSGTAHSYVSHYHLDIVPTIYRNWAFGYTQAYQYTYNHNTFEVHHMPSLYFNYQIGGLLVEVKPNTDSISVFLIKLCAIIGGTYTIASFIDSAIDTLFEERKQKYQLIN